VTAQATKKKAPPTAEVGGPEDLVLYSPEEVFEKRWLPFSPRTLRDKATRREIPHSKAGGRISFSRRHVREIHAAYEVRPLRERKQPA